MLATETAPDKTVPRPGSVRATVAVLLFLGLTALGGGIEMIVFLHGGTYLPADQLDRIPLVDSYLLPGLALGIVFGLGSLATGVGMLRGWHWAFLAGVERASGRHWSWSATLLVGTLFTCWLLFELAVLGGPWEAATSQDRLTGYLMYLVYGGVALLLLILPNLGGVRRYLAARAHR